MSRAPQLVIDPDIGPFGPRPHPHEPYPREYSTIVIPIGWPHNGTLIVPTRMSPVEWDRVIEFIALCRSALDKGIDSIGETSA